MEAIKAVIVVSPQETAVAPNLTVQENLELMAGVFKRVAYLLPFVHAVEMERAVISGNYAQIVPHLFWVLGYALVILVAAVFAF